MFVYRIFSVFLAHLLFFLTSLISLTLNVYRFFHGSWASLHVFVCFLILLVADKEGCMKEESGWRRRTLERMREKLCNSGMTKERKGRQKNLSRREWEGAGEGLTIEEKEPVIKDNEACRREFSTQSSSVASVLPSSTCLSVSFLYDVKSCPFRAFFTQSLFPLLERKGNKKHD